MDEQLQIKSTSQLLELANSLSIAIQMHMMSPGQAQYIWQKYLKDSGLLPPKKKKTFVEKT